MASIPRDKFHGVGGSYILDPKTGERTQVEKPTEPSPTGGARDKDGRELNTFHDALEPAFAAPAGDAPGAPPEKARPAKLSRLFGGGGGGGEAENTDTGKGS